MSLDLAVTGTLIGGSVETRVMGTRVVCLLRPRSRVAARERLKASNLIHKSQFLALLLLLVASISFFSTSNPPLKGVEPSILHVRFPIVYTTMMSSMRDLFIYRRGKIDEWCSF